MTNRLISINWTPVTDVNITGYNVYKVNGAPPNATKQFLADVMPRTADHYNYTAIEGTQYQFEVRSHDASGNESAPLEVFYPGGTTLYTPTDITPTGNPMNIVRDQAYLAKEEFINYPTGLKLTASSALYTSGALDVILQVASEEVNRYCRRHFGVQTIDEVYDGIRIGQQEPSLQTVFLNEGPIQSVNSVSIQVLKWFIDFSLDYLQVFPEKGFYQLVPFLGGNVSGIPLPSAVLTEGLLGKVWTNYTFGYDVIPSSVKFATSILATKLIGLQENPVSAQSVKFGRNFSLTWDKNTDPLMEKVKSLLNPYRLITYRRP